MKICAIWPFDHMVSFCIQKNSRFVSTGAHGSGEDMVALEEDLRDAYRGLVTKNAHFSLTEEDNSHMRPSVAATIVDEKDPTDCSCGARTRL